MSLSLIGDAAAAVVQTVSPRFRSTLWKIFGFTALVLALAWLGLDHLAAAALASSPAWVRIPVSILTGAGLLFGAAYLLAPVSALVAGFYADELAALVEQELDPRALGRALPFKLAMGVGLRFAGLAVVVNAVALLLLLIPGVNLVAFLGANGYLLGRAYFELAALRHRSVDQARALYRRHAGRIFLCGLWIAVLLSIPVVNLLTPLFAVAFMVRVYRRLDPEWRNVRPFDPAPSVPNAR